MEKVQMSIAVSKEVHSEKSWFLSGNKDYQLKGK